jgi:curved DNA-binding protein CbpA
MKERPSLYDLLGVARTVPVAEIQAGYRREVGVLESRRSTVSAEVFNDHMQLLRMAYSTLSDVASRTGYDIKLEATAAARAAPRPAAAAATPSLALGLAPQLAGTGASADVRADALSMRADALALRADAMLLRAGVPLPGERPGSGSSLTAGLTEGVKRIVRAIGLLVVLGFVAYGVTRCAVGGSAQKRVAMQEREAKAAEQITLQEYYQTHGVRPASIAEMQLLDSARRSKENAQRQGEQTRRQQEQEEKRFEADARRRGDQVAAENQRAEQEARYRAERDVEKERQLKARAEELKLEAELATNDANRRRLELQRKQTLEQLKNP